MSFSPYPPFPPYPPYPPRPPYAPYPPYPAVTARTQGTSASTTPTGAGPGPAGPAGPTPSTSNAGTGGGGGGAQYLHSISLPPFPGYHAGTGYHQLTKLIVDPNSVTLPGNLQFRSAVCHVTTLLFQLNANVVPNWFGVAVPNGITDFTKPNIFFHPFPTAAAGYNDADYPSKAGNWPRLFYYMEHLGYQADAAIQLYGAPRNQIVIMPFLTVAASDAGIFPAAWLGIVTDILAGARATVGGSGGPIVISEVVVSSFSAGLVYATAFRQLATGLTPLLKQIWDFDGYPKPTSDALGPSAASKVIKYDQGSEPNSIHMPFSRWAAYPNPAPNLGDPAPPKNSDDVHHDIRDFLFLHAATKR
jgi:hypothetical protein